MIAGKSTYNTTPYVNPVNFNTLDSASPAYHQYLVYSPKNTFSLLLKY
jgi:hypothetical protein